MSRYGTSHLMDSLPTCFLGTTEGSFLVLACFLALVFLVLLPAFAMWLSRGGEAMDDRRDCCKAPQNDICLASGIQEGRS